MVLILIFFAHPFLWRCSRLICPEQITFTMVIFITQSGQKRKSFLLAKVYKDSGVILVVMMHRMVFSGYIQIASQIESSCAAVILLRQILLVL